LAANSNFVQTDDRFLEQVKRAYEIKMCGFWRRYLSLKSHRAFRILSVSFHSPPSPSSFLSSTICTTSRSLDSNLISRPSEKFTPNTRPSVVPFDDFVLQEMMFAYRHPEKITTTDDWIKWVFRLRCKDRRHALEFVEGWNTARIAIYGTIPWLSSCLVGVIWTATGGDAQTAFTITSFILTSSSSKTILILYFLSSRSKSR
jgi:hypothetical protein